MSIFEKDLEKAEKNWTKFVTKLKELGIPVNKENLVLKFKNELHFNLNDGISKWEVNFTKKNSPNGELKFFRIDKKPEFYYIENCSLARFVKLFTKIIVEKILLDFFITEEKMTKEKKELGKNEKKLETLKQQLEGLEILIRHNQKLIERMENKNKEILKSDHKVTCDLVKEGESFYDKY